MMHQLDYARGGKTFLLTRVDWWFAYTETTVEVLRKAGFPPERITCLENAIDTAGFKADLASWNEADIAAARARLGVAVNAPVGVFCGSLYPEKRLELLIESSDLIRQQVPDFELVVIGDGPSMPQMREAAASRPWLHLLGARKGREKALYFRLGSVMLNPGAAGLHIIDAFCAGLVFLTTSTAKHGPEIAYLRHGENGFMTGDSTEEYSAAVLRSIRDPAHLARAKAAALADADRYTLENMVYRFANGIEQCLKVQDASSNS